MIYILINVAVEMDLFGQVCAETIGTVEKLDFVEGTYKSKGGQSFVFLPSIKGKISQTINLHFHQE
ncbi:hypothetical protein SH2C18_51140 [Clostridium sediminicola]|uniref:acetyl-CoA hydrolase/transferase C-terminal domain-containing protein n=1 Tax=Clostridium sediminicola TaxID=3114879 RepID=UPI0031F272F7